MAQKDYAFVYDCISAELFIITGNILFELTTNLTGGNRVFSRKDGLKRTCLKVIDQYNH